jgi:general stress protein 26
MEDIKVQNDALKTTVKEFLNTHRKAIFAFVDEHGYPTTSLMLYSIDDDLNVYFGTRRAFGKYADVTRQPVVSLSVVEEALDPLRVVDIRGTAVEVSVDESEKVHTFFKTKNDSKYYVEGAEDFVMFKITPNFLRWADATSGSLVLTDLSL